MKNIINFLARFFHRRSKGMFMVLRYALAGVSAGIIQFAVYAFFASVLHWWYLYATILSFLISAVCGFFFQKLWTFRDQSFEKIHTQGAWYGAIALFSFFANTVSMYYLVERFGVFHLSAQGITIIFVGGVSFLLNKVITFKK